MLPLTLESFRLFLHITAAAVWVGGQLTLLGLLPTVRRLGPEATTAVARTFARVAWTAFAVLVVTGVWNVLAVEPGDRSTAWNATLGLKLLLVAATGAGAAIHSLSGRRPIIAAAGAVGLVTGLAAVWVGVVLTGGA